MTTTFAIDPGPLESGWCFFDGVKVIAGGIAGNWSLLKMIDETAATDLAIERIASYGMPVGAEVLETCEWVGEFRNQWRHRGKGEASLIYRMAVKMHLCKDSRAKDLNIRQAIIDLFPATGGGKVPQIGVKNKPGPLFGVAKHIWAALAVAITHQQRMK